MRELLRFGTWLDWDGDRLVGITDRSGRPQARLHWGDDALASATIGRGRERILVAGATQELAPVGAVHQVIVGRGATETWCTAIAWTRPTTIPAIGRPALLPPGTGSMLLDVLALIARRTGVAALQYAGPYPTSALWRTLLYCFTTTGDEATFTADALGRALRVATDPIPIDFVPAPFERVAINDTGSVDLRDEVERVRLGGVVYTPRGSPARLVRDGDRWAAEVWFGDEPWARVAELDTTGALVDGPHPLPRVKDPIIGEAFPVELRAALAELVAEAVALPLADAARAILRDAELRWADLGAAPAAWDDGGFALNAMLWQRLAPHGMTRLALAIAEALAPVVAARAQERLAGALAAAKIG